MSYLDYAQSNSPTTRGSEIWPDLDVVAFVPRVCSWHAAASGELVRLARLEPGWDGHSAKKIDRATMAFATTVIGAMMLPDVPKPSIHPLPHGGIQFEWHRRGWDVEIEVVAPNRIEVLVHDLGTADDETFALGADLSRLAGVLERIKG
jgi:hypothetical protein